MKPAAFRLSMILLTAITGGGMALFLRPDPAALARQGIAAYREGRYEEALALFSRAEQQAGDRTRAELLYDQALAALRAGQLVVAEAKAEKAAARGGKIYRGPRDFLLGNASFARCEAAEREASQTDAGPSAWDVAILHAEAARDSWERAAASRAKNHAALPEAQRNVELALRKIESLRGRKFEAIEKKKAQIRHRIAIRPELEEAGAEARQGRKVAQEQEVSPMETRLAPDRILTLLERLAAKEAEKRQIRSMRHISGNTKVEKDW